ncbi:DUF6624 domain-containing protein [Streptomyces sp. NPDC059003]|uniref:DUF6624 domain-containing protein n=1 Tax=Streptomyces sp. NPDC059003 TaxID=3346691 RepID=UPI0036786A30
MDQPRSPEVAAELVSRAAEDQRVRLTPLDQWNEETTAALRAVDSANTSALKQIIAEQGWPGIRLVGREAAAAAWLLAQHADADVDFQEHARDLLAQAVDAGDAEAQHLAYLTDRCLTGRGQPQVYGTQYIDNGDGTGLRPQPIADPDRLDARRAAVGLEPHADYDARMRSPDTGR